MKFPPKPTYRELLLDPRWQKKRLETLEAHLWACDNCSAEDRTLHVHHKVYWPGCAPWEYGDGWLAVLCDECHSNETASAKEDRAANIETGVDPEFHKRIFSILPTFMCPGDTEDMMWELNFLDGKLRCYGWPTGVFDVLHKIVSSDIPNILVLACEMQAKDKRGFGSSQTLDKYLQEAISERNAKGGGEI